MDTESNTEAAPSGVALTISLLQKRLKTIAGMVEMAETDVARFDDYLTTRRGELEQYHREAEDVNRALSVLQAA